MKKTWVLFKSEYNVVETEYAFGYVNDAKKNWKTVKREQKSGYVNNITKEKYVWDSPGIKKVDIIGYGNSKEELKTKFSMYFI